MISRDEGFDESALTVDGLERIAGDSPVFIEQRDPSTKTFGTGKKTKQSMRQFLADLKKQRTDVYLTTQPLPEDEYGAPSVLCGTPVTELVRAGAIPVRPRIMGNLVPSSINLWAGVAEQGSSSNLHHDFHDNIYCLLSGRKRFVLAPPSACEGLYLHGRVGRLLPNGLINYAGNFTRPDGALPIVAVEFCKRVLKQLQKSGAASGVRQRQSEAFAGAWEAFESWGPQTVEEARRRLKAAEALLEEAEEAAEDDEGSESDDAEGVAATGARTHFSDDSEDSDEPVPPAKKLKKSAAGPPTKSACGKDDAALADEMWAALLNGGGGGLAAPPLRPAAPPKKPVAVSSSSSIPPRDKSMPPHFSRVPLPALRQQALHALAKGYAADRQAQNKKHKGTASPCFSSAQAEIDAILALPESKKRFPAFSCTRFACIDLKPGQQLYLPSGWFHEVVSYSDPVDAEAAPSKASVHMALNYWYHPAQILEGAKAFAMPYVDSWASSTYETQLADLLAPSSAAPKAARGSKA
jgi:hypothetical protein